MTFRRQATRPLLVFAIPGVRRTSLAGMRVGGIRTFVAPIAAAPIAAARVEVVPSYSRNAHGRAAFAADAQYREYERAPGGLP